MPQNQSTAPQFPTADQVADAIANHFNVVIVGIANLNPQIPQKTMVEAIVIAIGNLVSGYSKSPDLATTLQSRGDLQDAFVRALRKRVPAIDPVQAPAEPAPPASAHAAANDGDAQAVQGTDTVDAAPLDNPPANMPSQSADSSFSPYVYVAVDSAVYPAGTTMAFYQDEPPAGWRKATADELDNWNSDPGATADIATA